MTGPKLDEAGNPIEHPEPETGEVGMFHYFCPILVGVCLFLCFLCASPACISRLSLETLYSERSVFLCTDILSTFVCLVASTCRFCLLLLLPVLSPETLFYREAFVQQQSA